MSGVSYFVLPSKGSEGSFPPNSLPWVGLQVMCGSVPITVRNLNWPPSSVRHTTRWTRRQQPNSNKVGSSHSGGRTLSMPTPQGYRLAWQASGSPELAFLPHVQPHAHASTTIRDGDVVARGQRLHASKSRTARYSGGRTLSMPTPQRYRLT